MRILLVSTVAVIPAFSGCASFSPSDVAKPTDVTVEAAMTSVGAGFAGLKRELKEGGDIKLGMVACKVAVNFNVTASADQGGKLVLDASTSPTSVAQSTLTNTVSATAHAEQTNNSSASRGNTIAIEMYNVACLPKDTLATISPDKVATVARALGDRTFLRGPTVFSAPVKKPFTNLEVPNKPTKGLGG